MFRLRKMTVAVAAGAALMSVPAAAPAQFDSKTTTTLVALLLAQKLGIDPTAILQLAMGGQGIGASYYPTAGYQPAYNYYPPQPYTSTPYDLAPVYVMQRAAPTTVQPVTIIQYRRSGQTWDQIASRLRVPQTRYRTIVASHQLDPNWWADTTTQQVLLVPRTQVVQLRNQGLSWRDIANATIVAREARQPVTVIATNWRQTRDWNRVATRYRVQPRIIRTRVAELRRTRRMPTTWRRVVVVPRTTTVAKAKSNNGAKVIHAKNGNHRALRIIHNGTVKRLPASKSHTTRKVSNHTTSHGTVHKVTTTHTAPHKKTVTTKTTTHAKAKGKASAGKSKDKKGGGGKGH